MVDHDDWQLGDEPASTICPSCGKRNRAGQARCVICGTAFGDDIRDAPPLRSLGEAMARSRPPGRPRRRERPWLWPATAGALLLLVGLAYWYQQPPGRSLSLDPSTRSPSAAPRASADHAGVARPESAAVAPAPDRAGIPSERPRLAVPAPPRVPAAPAVVATARPESRPPQAPAVERAAAERAATERAASQRAAAERAASQRAAAERAASERAAAERAAAQNAAAERAAAERAAAARSVAPTVSQPAQDDEDAAAVSPPERNGPREEKPSLGTDLVAARRAYADAVRQYNAHADRYNDLADEYQRVDEGTDSDRAAGLRARLDAAREAADDARAHAEDLRARMEEVQARYR